MAEAVWMGLQPGRASARVLAMRGATAPILKAQLALSGVDNRTPTHFTALVDWRRAVQDALSDCLPLIESTGSEVAVEWPADDAPAMPLTGDHALIDHGLRHERDPALGALRDVIENLAADGCDR